MSHKPVIMLLWEDEHKRDLETLKRICNPKTEDIKKREFAKFVRWLLNYPKPPSQLFFDLDLGVKKHICWPYANLADFLDVVDSIFQYWTSGKSPFLLDGDKPVILLRTTWIDPLNVSPEKFCELRDEYDRENA